MRGLLRSVILLAALTGGGYAGLRAWPIGEDASRITLDGDARRGAYLARAAGCVACHTDTAAQGPAMAGGAPLDTPFGSFVPPNITPDFTHGIGGWSKYDLARALREGISPEGQPYYPAFPFEFYAGFSDQDIADLWAALATVPPVAETRGENDMRFPFSMRSGLKLWRATALLEAESAPVLGRSDDWNRGRELVEGAAHCGACHTGRGLLGGLDADSFGGNDDLPGGSAAPSIRAADLKEDGWTASALAYALETGITPSGDVFGGSMAEVVEQGTSFLDEADRRAIATYLLDAAPVPSDPDALAQLR
ncbi:mono/diheme cytochrome c family protein [Limimaricola variabilis]|uniref:Mono/diheme cytochrome c family protein n=1 Tax=Limimaricola variabilis TaxID=1492771 RepID=A0ABR6HJU8_9RHOB|nr:cytochrome c [Limimaricola variabilis]MBB3710757.1 mono/diheme cytochrome c family protein [Limimaricola variabilis]